MIRRYRSTDLRRVMEQIREDLGPDALILGTRTFREDHFGVLGREIVEVWAGPGNDPLLSRLPKALLAPYRLLVEQGVRQDLVRELMEELRGLLPSIPEREERAALGALAQLMLRRIPDPLPEPPGPRTMALLGLTGVGKTTTALKLALREIHRGREAVIITMDTERVGGAELLRLYGKVAGVPVEGASSTEELMRALLRHRSKDLVLIDTPGVNYHQNGWVKKLRELVTSSRGIEYHLVISAQARDEEVSRLIRRLRGLPLSALLFSKLDEASNFGVIFNQTVSTGLPLSYFTTGQRVPEDVEGATKIRLVDLILRISEVGSG